MSLVDRNRTHDLLVKDKGTRIGTTVFPMENCTGTTQKFPTQTIEIVPLGSPETQPGPYLPGAYEESGKGATDKDSYENRVPLSAFEQELRHLINKMSMENGSNTPDNILSEYLITKLVDNIDKRLHQVEEKTIRRGRSQGVRTAGIPRSQF